MPIDRKEPASRKHQERHRLTTTDDTREVSRCYDRGCNVYMTKPMDYEQFCEAIRKLRLFPSVVIIPNGG